MEDTNVNSEMSELVHLAEEWAAVPNDKEIMPLYRTILEKAAVILINQLGIKTVEEFEKCFGAPEKASEKVNSEERIDVVRENETEYQLISPLPKEEFKKLLKNGWPRKSTSPVGKLTQEEFQNILKMSALNSPLPDSMMGSRRRTSMLASLCPMSPIVSEGSKVSPMKKLANTEKRSPEPAVSRRLFNTSTPILKSSSQHRRLTPSNSLRSVRAERHAPVQRTATPRVYPFTPRPMDGEPPLENRASRLRRIKIEKELRNDGGKDNRKSNIETLNISFSDLSFNSFR